MIFCHKKFACLLYFGSQFYTGHRHFEKVCSMQNGTSFILLLVFELFVEEEEETL